MKMNVIISSTKDERLKLEEKRKSAKPNSLAIMRPDLLAEWDWAKNDEIGLDPYQLLVGSGKKAWWTCPNHEESYYAQIYKRAKDGTGCPYCDGKKVLKGFNDLASQYPHLLEEWDYDLNDISPDEVMYGSNKKYHWRCKNGHTWTAKARNRSVLGQGCLTCAREVGTKRMKEVAKNRTKTHEQFMQEASEANKKVTVIGKYTAAAKKIRVKCNYCGYEFDMFPGNILSGSGCRTCSIDSSSRRVTEEQLKARIEEGNPNVAYVGGYTKMNSLASFECKTCGYRWETTPESVVRGSGCYKCFTKKLSESRLKSHEQVVSELAEKNPNIEMIGTYHNSNELVKGRCKTCGYEWDMNISHVLGGTGCPQCAGKLQLTHEDFIERMNNVNPNIEILGRYTNSKGRVDARCKVCNYTWNVIAGNLLSGAGCPSCAGNLKKTNEQFLEELKNSNPNIEALEEYNGANNKIKFRCKTCGNEWDSTPHRILSGGGCPECNTSRHSFFEHALLYALRQALGEDKVLSRYRRSIGFELDVYIPSLNIAFEPGEWFYHKNVVDRDLDKFIFSSTARIDLTIIYCGYDEDEKPPFDCITTKSHLTVHEWDDAVKMIKFLMDKYSISYDNVDWNKVKLDAMKHSGKRTTKQFIKELSEIQPEIEVLGRYTGARSRIKVRCKECGRTWSPIASSLLYGFGCKKCKSKAAAAKLKKTQEQFVQELAVLNKDVEVIGRYDGWDHKVRVKCKLCGHEWNAMAGYLLKGSKCPKCFKSGKKTHDEFIEELFEKNPSVTVLGEYTTNKDKVKTQCNECGYVWNIMPESLLAGKGCPCCGIWKSAKKRKKTQEKFVAQLAEKNPRIRAVGEYHYAREKMTFRCLDCGCEWDATPDNILRGRGCPDCRYKKAAETRKKNKANATLAQEDTSQ